MTCHFLLGLLNPLYILPTWYVIAHPSQAMRPHQDYQSWQDQFRLKSRARYGQQRYKHALKTNYDSVLENRMV